MSLATSFFHASPWALAALLIGSAIALKIIRTGRREKFLPPGPPTKPLLGNILEFPIHVAHFKYTEVSAPPMLRFPQTLTFRLLVGTKIRRCHLSQNCFRNNCRSRTSIPFTLSSFPCLSSAFQSPSISRFQTSVRAIREIFETHNAITCDRPPHTLTEQLTGGNHILFIGYGGLDFRPVLSRISVLTHVAR